MTSFLQTALAVLLLATSRVAGADDPPRLAHNETWELRLHSAGYAEITGTEQPPFVVPGNEGEVITKVAVRGPVPARPLLAVAVEFKAVQPATLNISDEPLREALGKGSKALRYVTLTVPSEWKPDQLKLSGIRNWRGFLAGNRKAGDTVILVAVYELTESQQKEATAGKLKLSIAGLKDVPPAEFTVVRAANDAGAAAAPPAPK